MDAWSELRYILNDALLFARKTMRFVMALVSNFYCGRKLGNRAALATKLKIQDPPRAHAINLLAPLAAHSGRKCQLCGHPISIERFRLKANAFG